MAAPSHSSQTDLRVSSRARPAAGTRRVTVAVVEFARRRIVLAFGRIAFARLVERHVSRRECQVLGSVSSDDAG